MLWVDKMLRPRKGPRRAWTTHPYATAMPN